MKIIISGRDRTDEFAGPLRADAQARLNDPELPPIPQDISALGLAAATSEQDFDERYLRLIRIRAHIDTRKYDIPHRPGFIGSIQHAVRKFLWKLLRFQLDRIAFRQNLVNSQLVHALEFERARVRKLEQRVAELERRAGP